MGYLCTENKNLEQIEFFEIHWIEIKMNISCNICKQPLKGRSLVTSCSHIFCPGCISNLSSSTSSSKNSNTTNTTSTTNTDTNTCPICSKYLELYDIGDTVVGFGSASTSNISIQDQLWEYILQNQSWSQSIKLLDEINDTVIQMQNMIKVQLLILIKNNTDEIKKITEEKESQKNMLLENDSTIFNLQRNSDANVKRLESLLLSSEGRVLELQKAYEHKKNRCTAWENAYHEVSNKRNELMNNTATGPGPGSAHNSPSASAVATPSPLTSPSICPPNNNNPFAKCMENTGHSNNPPNNNNPFAKWMENTGHSNNPPDNNNLFAKYTKNTGHSNKIIIGGYSHHRYETGPVPVLPPRESNPDEFFINKSHPRKRLQQQQRLKYQKPQLLQQHQQQPQHQQAGDTLGKSSSSSSFFA